MGKKWNSFMAYQKILKSIIKAKLGEVQNYFILSNV